MSLEAACFTGKTRQKDMAMRNSSCSPETSRIWAMQAEIDKLTMPIHLMAGIHDETPFPMSQGIQMVLCRSVWPPRAPK